MKYYLRNMDMYPALLPIFTYRRRGETVPLWTSPSSDPGGEYFEFQVLADESGEDSEERENNSRRRCQICDVDVPKSYWRDHKVTTKHLAFVAIAESAMDRTRRLMSTETSAISFATFASYSDNTYYCPSCSRAVSLPNRSAHEKSREHLDSVLYDELINSLLILYKEKSKLKAVCENIVKKIGVEEIVKVLQFEKYFLYDSDAITIKNIIYQIKDELKDEHGNKDIISTDSDVDISKEIISKTCAREETDQYFKNTKGLLNENKIINDDHPSDVNHGNRKRLFEANYMEDIDTINVFCGVCQKTVLTINELDHINSKKHKKRILLKNFNKEHETERNIFLRENYLEDIDGTNVYCGICQKNILVANERDHVVSRRHKKLKNSIFDKEVQINRNKNDDDNIIHTITKPDSASTNANNTSFNKTDVASAGPASQKSNKKLYYLFSKTDDLNILKCKTCDKKFSADKAEDHKSDSNHKQMYNDLLQSHRMVKIKKKVICGCCREVMKLGREYSHFDSEQHRRNLDTGERLGKNELNKLAQKLFDNFIAHNNKEDNINTSSNQHLLDTKDQCSDDASTSINITSFNKTEVSNVAPVRKSKNRHRHNLFNKTDDPNIFNCKVCDINFSADKAEDHKSDSNHKQMYNDLLESHKMVKIKKKVICGCCREVMKLGREYSHFDSEQHRRNLDTGERLGKNELNELAQKLYDNFIAHGITKVSILTYTIL